MVVVVSLSTVVPRVMIKIKRKRNHKRPTKGEKVERYRTGARIQFKSLQNKSLSVCVEWNKYTFFSFLTLLIYSSFLHFFFLLKNYVSCYWSIVYEQTCLRNYDQHGFYSHKTLETHLRLILNKYWMDLYQTTIILIYINEAFNN